MRGVMGGPLRGWCLWDGGFADGEDGEEFPVALRAGEGGGGDADGGPAELDGGEVEDLVDAALPDALVADDAVLADVAWLGLELRLDEEGGPGVGGEEGVAGGEDFGQGDEGDVGDEGVNGLGDEGAGEGAGVGLLEGDDARVVPEGGVELAGADVDGVDAAGAALEEDVGEAAGGGADVEGDGVPEVMGEGLQGGEELAGAAADVGERGGGGERRVRVEEASGLVDGRAVGEDDLAVGDESLGGGSGVGEPEGDAELVGAALHLRYLTVRQPVTWRRTAMSPPVAGSRSHSTSVTGSWWRRTPSQVE